MQKLTPEKTNEIINRVLNIMNLEMKHVTVNPEEKSAFVWYVLNEAVNRQKTFHLKQFNKQLDPNKFRNAA